MNTVHIGIMPQVDAEFIIGSYSEMTAQNSSPKQRLGAIRAAVLTGLSLPQHRLPPEMETALQQATRCIIEDATGMNALACVLILEHYSRTRENTPEVELIDWPAMERACNLVRQCSHCSLKGHNSRNCAPELVQFGKRLGLRKLSARR